MPRRSPEARIAAALLSAPTPAAPPKTLSKEGAVIWADIAASKPADWFDAGSRILLETYCETAVHTRSVAKKLRGYRKVGAWDECKPWEKRMALMSTTLATLATKLRLSVQSTVDWHSKKLGESGVSTQQGDTLLGGRAVWGDIAKPN